MRACVWRSDANAAVVPLVQAAAQAKWLTFPPSPPPLRCYMEGAGVERSIERAADCFRRAGNEAELGELAALQRQYAAVQLGGGAGGPPA